MFIGSKQRSQAERHTQSSRFEIASRPSSHATLMSMLAEHFVNFDSFLLLDCVDFKRH